MNNDTTNMNANTQVDAPQTAVRRTATMNWAEAGRTIEGRTEEVGKTTAEFVAFTVQDRFYAAARQAVAVELARFGAEEFTAISTSPLTPGFPVGSEFGALCPQDDLSEDQAKKIYEITGEAVRAEAKHMTEEVLADKSLWGAAPKFAAVIAFQLAEWEEGAALEWDHMCRLKAQFDKEDEEAAKEKEAKEKEEAPAPRLYAGRPLTPGMEYVEQWLGGMNGRSDEITTEWIAKNLDLGYFVDCPRCHFLHFPQIAFTWVAEKSAPPIDGCDVCAAAESAARFGYSLTDMQEVLAGAGEELQKARVGRAKTLCDLWMGGSLAADTWVLAEMAKAVSATVAKAQRKEAQGKEG